MKIYLVRHAQTKTNLAGMDFDDKKSIGLSKKGESQARKLAQRFIKFELDKIYVSEAKRSYQTVLPLVKVKSFPINKDFRLNEANFGIFSGLNFEEAKKKYPRIYEDRARNKWNYRLPQGESFKDVSERLDSFFHSLNKRTDTLKSILVMTHATVLKVFVVKYLNFSLKKADSIHFYNTSVSLLEIKNKKINASFINDCSHLNNNVSKSKRIYKR